MKLCREGGLRAAEVVVADSVQCYRYMPIGSALPSADLLSTVPHHLTNFLSPARRYSVVDFVRRATPVIADLHRQKKVPIVSGGNGYYLLRLLCGVPTTPPSDPTLRRQLQNRLRIEGLPALYRELQQHDPVYATRIGFHDPYRTARALEIIAASGKPVSLHTLGNTPRADWSILLIGLERERTELRARIETRVSDMFQQGLVAEVQALLGRGYTSRDPALRAIGYRQFFDTEGTLRNCESPEVCLAIQREIVGATQRYAKRQRTFFRQLREIEWFSPTDYQQITARIEKFLSMNR